MTASGRCSWQPLETISCFYYCIYFKGNQLKQINFFVIAYTLEAVVQRCSIKKVSLEISQNSQENTCCQSLFFNKVADLTPSTLLQKRLWHRCFPANFYEISKNTFLHRIPLMAASDTSNY